jgi:treponemal membrane protein B
MIIKNTGSKIISIGTTVLMPDGEMKVNKEIASTPAIRAFERMGLVKVEDDGDEKARKNATRKAAEEAAAKKAAEEANAAKKAEEDAAKKKAAEEAAKTANQTK